MGSEHRHVHQRSAAHASAAVHAHVGRLHHVDDARLTRNANVEVDRHQAAEHELVLELHRAAVGAVDAAEHLAVRPRLVPEPTHFEHEHGAALLGQTLRDHRAAVAGADNHRVRLDVRQGTEVPSVPGTVFSTRRETSASVRGRCQLARSRSAAKRP